MTQRGGGGISPLYFKNWRQGGVDFWDLTEKLAKGGGYPHFGHFLGILDISGENGVPYLPLRQCKLAEKTVHLPSGVISEVLPRVDLGPRHAGSAKLTLGRTSEMTQEGRCTVFSDGLHCLGGQ